MAVIDLFLRIDKSLVNKSIAEILTQFNSVLKIAANEDNKTLENIVNALDKLYHGKEAKTVPIDDRGALYERILALQETIGTNSTAKVITDIGEIIKQASEVAGTAARYALKMLNPFAVVSDSLYGKEGVLKDMLPELVQFKLDDKTTYAGMSETYIQKRAEMLLSLTKSHNTSGGLSQTDYHDTQLKAFAPSAGKFNTVFFGSDGDDDLSNLLGIMTPNADFIFGGKGNDTLIGNKGRDYLEGGVDYDTYHIDGHDTVFDSDMKGQLHFPKEVKAVRFVQSAEGI